MYKYVLVFAVVLFTVMLSIRLMSEYKTASILIGAF